MSMFSNQKNIDEYLKELDKEYKKYAEQYGEKLFNYKAYKDRYLEALHLNVNLENFLKKELEIIKITKDKLLQIKQSEEKIDDSQNLESIASQIDKYPEANLGEKVSMEIKKLIGACQEIYPQAFLYKTYVPLNHVIIYNSSLSNLENVLQEPYGSSFKTYLEIIKNPLIPSIKANVYAQQTLKDIAIGIKTMSMILAFITKNNEIADFVNKLNNIIKDFRLEIFQVKDI